MASESTIHTDAAIKRADQELFAWTRRWDGSLAVGVLMGHDHGPVHAITPRPLVVGSIGDMNGMTQAAMLAQAEVAVLVLLNELAERSELGEHRFRELYVDFRRRLLGEQGLGLCDDCS